MAKQGALEHRTTYSHQLKKQTCIINCNHYNRNCRYIPFVLFGSLNSQPLELPEAPASLKKTTTDNTLGMGGGRGALERKTREGGQANRTMRFVIKLTSFENICL